jgi:xanthine dehydrogenase accessory factor
MTGIVLIRGGGDLASGVALRLFRAGFAVVMTEIAQPLAVRRTVSFAEAVYEGEWTVEKVRARRADDASELSALLELHVIPVLVDPDLDLLRDPSGLPGGFTAVVDGRLTKKSPEPIPNLAPDPANVEQGMRGLPALIALGPGSSAGVNCDAVVETMRGHTLGRVYWRGSAMADTNLPEGDPRRVLRAPANGIIHPHSEIGQRVEAGQVLAEVRADESVKFITSPFAGVLRGMIRPGREVTAGLKIGDVDSRNDPSLCYLVSDKSLAVGGGVLEALLAWQNGRGAKSQLLGGNAR